MGAYRHIQGDHLLQDRATWEAYTGETEAANLDKSVTYASGVSIKCMIAPAGRRWESRFPDADLSRSAEAWLKHDSTVTALDRLTHRGTAYRVKDVTDWQGAGRIALLEIMEGISE